MSKWPFVQVKIHIKVFAELPQGAIEAGLPFIRHREARGYVNGEYKTYYHCPKCGGWIEGFTVHHGEHTLGPLSGRSGYAEDCKRCGYELTFVGIVA